MLPFINSCEIHQSTQILDVAIKMAFETSTIVKTMTGESRIVPDSRAKSRESGPTSQLAPSAEPQRNLLFQILFQW